jgi:hypothetical protein
MEKKKLTKSFIFGLLSFWTLSIIQYFLKHNVLENASFSILGAGGTNSVGSVRQSMPQSVAPSNISNRVGVPHLKIETSSFHNIILKNTGQWTKSKNSII